MHLNRSSEVFFMSVHYSPAVPGDPDNETCFQTLPDGPCRAEPALRTSASFNNL